MGKSSELTLNDAERHEVGLPIPDEVRDQVIKGLQRGIGMMSLAEILGVSDHTIEEIREANADKLPDWRAASKRKLKSFITLSGERLCNEVRDIPIAVLPVSFAIAVDKLLLLEGEATVRVDHVHRVEPGKFSTWMAQMTAPTPHQAAIDVQVLDAQHSIAGAQPEQVPKPADSDPGGGPSKPGGG